MNLNFKMNRKRWISLGIGVLALAAVALVTFRSQQLAEQARLKNDLEVVQKRLSALEIDQVSTQLQQTRDQIDRCTDATVDLKNRLATPTDSIAASDQLYRIAALAGVQIVDIAADDQTSATLSGVPVNVFGINTTVEGDWSAVIAFIAQLKSDFSACMVERADVAAREDGSGASANLRLLIYTYKGS